MVTQPPSGELAKATISNLDDPSAQAIEVLFNPTEYSMSKSNTWQQVKVVGSNVPRLEFTSGGATSLSMDLMFDTYESGENVRDYTGKIYDLTKIEPETVYKTSGVGRPTKCMFSWGKVFNFAAVIKSVSVQYTLFKSDGIPVRAKMSLTLEECEDDTKKSPQNPTTQGTMGETIYVVKPGDTLDWIAHRELGDSALWRHIADENDLDNPMVLQPGQVLGISTQ